MVSENCRKGFAGVISCIKAGTIPASFRLKANHSIPKLFSANVQRNIVITDNIVVAQTI